MTYINIQTLIEVIRNNFALLPLWFIAWKHLKVKDKLSHLDLKSIMAFHWPKISNIYAIYRFSMPPPSASYQLTFHIISGCSAACGRKCVPDVGGICYNLWLINGSSRTNRSQVLLKRERWSLMIRRLRNSASRWKTWPHSDSWEADWFGIRYLQRLCDTPRCDHFYCSSILGASVHCGLSKQNHDGHSHCQTYRPPGQQARHQCPWVDCGV